MSITFPLAIPDHNFRAWSVKRNESVGVGRSKFSGHAQVYDWGGSWWSADIQIPPKHQRDEADAWIAFLTSLRGPLGTFTMHPDPLGRTVRGTHPGTPVLDGAQGPYIRTIATDGWTPSQTGVLLKGDYLRIGGLTGKIGLHQVLADVDSDGAGDATIEIWPGLKAAYNDGQAISLASIYGEFRLVEPVEVSSQHLQLYGLSFSAVENVVPP